MFSTMNDRFSWAVSLIRPEATDIILDVGCGTGILIERIAPLLSGGKIIGIDKSPSMIKAAEKRNKHYIETGVVQLVNEEFSLHPVANEQFDKLLAFNVSDFWETPSKYTPLVKSNLKTGGSFYLFYQPPFDKTRELASKAEQVLENFLYKIQDIHIENLHPAPAFCIIASPG